MGETILTALSKSFGSSLASAALASSRKRCDSVTSAHVHNAPLEEMMDLTATQLVRNINHALAAIQGEGSTVQ